MKIDNSLVISLIDNDDPFPALWRFINSRVWTTSTPDTRLYYDQETRMVDLETFLTRTYPEFYSDALVSACARYAPDIPGHIPLVVMDSMSIREGILLASQLRSKGYEVSLDYGFSAVPSDTESFKKKVNFERLRNELRFREIKDEHSVRLSGNEQLIWSSFPDRLLSTLSSGRVKYGVVDDLFKTTLKVSTELLEQLESEVVTFTSDHGYMRADTAYTLRLARQDQLALAEVMGGDRSIQSTRVEDLGLVDSGLLVRSEESMVVRGLYTWPVRGKYSLYQHGGLSLAECLTPVIRIVRPRR